MVEPSMRAASSPSSREALLRTAKASPEIAGRHEKDAWLSLYTDDAVLEDPVGTPASHRGRRKGRLGDEIGRFYEAFIAQSGIEMVVRRDIVSDMHVFRAVDIHTTNLKTGLQMKVPANLLYEIVARDGGLGIRRMQAHWELNRMSRMLMGEGLRGARTIAVMNWSMLRAFGAKWLMRYFKASQEGVGRKGRDLVERLASEVGSDGDTCFAPRATVELPGGATASVTEFLEGCTSLEVREAGFIAELDARAEHVERLRWFWEA
jgi:hypothetical protein